MYLKEKKKKTTLIVYKSKACSLNNATRSEQLCESLQHHNEGERPVRMVTVGPNVSATYTYPISDFRSFNSKKKSKMPFEGKPTRNKNDFLASETETNHRLATNCKKMF